MRSHAERAYVGYITVAAPAAAQVAVGWFAFWVVLVAGWLWILLGPAALAACDVLAEWRRGRPHRV